MQVLAAARHVARGVARGELLPQPRRLVGVDARAPDPADEEAARGERAVADLLGGEPVRRPAAEPLVGRVRLEGLGVGHRGLAVGGGEHDAPLERLQVPAGVDEGAGEPVEQLRVGRKPALAAEVRRGRDQPAAEEQGPVAVHDHARGEGVPPVEEPPGEAEAVSGQVLRERQDGLGRARLHALGRRVVGPAREDEGGPGSGQLPHAHDLGERREERVLLAAGDDERPPLLLEARTVPQDVVLAKSRLLGRRPLGPWGGRGPGRAHRARRRGPPPRTPSAGRRRRAARRRSRRPASRRGGGRGAARADLPVLPVPVVQDAAAEVVHDRPRLRGLSVEEEAKPARAARAVVGQRDVVPAARGDRRNGLDLDRVVGERRGGGRP